MINKTLANEAGKVAAKRIVDKSLSRQTKTVADVYRNTTTKPTEKHIRRII